MLEHVDKEFMKAKRSRKLPGGVVFVGGSANLAGLEDFAKEKLSLPTSIGKVRGITGLLDATKNPEMATPIGIMMLDAFFSIQGTHSDDSGASYFNPGVIISKLKSKLSK
jgi:cell division protein FtsA